jgi:hypothetical protein
MDKAASPRHTKDELLKYHLSYCLIFLLLFLSYFNSFAAENKLNFEVRLLSGGVTMLDYLKGTKGTVIIPRDGSCETTKQILPTLSSMERKYSKLGYTFIHLYIEQEGMTKLAIRDRANYKLTGHSIVDMNSEISKNLHLQDSSKILVFNFDGELTYQGDIFGLKKTLSASSDKVLNAKTATTAVSTCPIKAKPRPVEVSTTFNGDIYNLLERKCIQCHTDKKSFVSLIDYPSVLGRSKMIQYVVEKHLMPPWQVKPGLGPWVNDLALTDSEKTVLLNWLSHGAPEGTSPKISKVHWEEDWTLGPPDHIIKLPKSISVPAEGVMEYQHFIVDTPFKKDVWVKGFEVLTPPVVVHHVLFHVLKDKKDLDPKHFPYNFISRFGWALGNPAGIFPSDVGALIPAGSKIAITVHYQPTGKKTVDNLTRIGFKLYKTKPKFERKEWAMVDEKLVIPPHVSDHVVQIKKNVDVDSYLIALNAHMHLRGKSSNINVIYPDGKTETLLDVNPYNFNHQFVYQYQKPKLIPKGSTIECINHFDNSRSNPVNPDPTKTVLWGDNTTDEMSICSIYYFQTK